MGNLILPEKLRHYSADVEYNKMTGTIIPLTGHESMYRRNGRLISPAQRAEHFWTVLKYFNEKLNWDWPQTVLDACELMYLGLSEAARYSGEDFIQEGTGENTAAHSPHAVLRGIKIVRAAEKLDPSIVEHPDFLPLCQVLSKALMVHDFGEVGGEPGSLGQQIKTGVKKDKPRMERLAMDYFLTLALHLAEKYPGSGRETKRRAEFMRELGRVKEGAGIQGSIIVSDDDLYDQLNRNLGERPRLSPAMQTSFDQLVELWDMIETKGARERFTDAPFNHLDGFNLPFIALLTSACEHVQGSAHFYRFLSEEKQDGLRDAFGMVNGGNTKRLRFSQTKRAVGNFIYNESEIGPIFAAARPGHPVEQALARAIRDEVYRYNIRLLEVGPKVIYLGKTPPNEAPHNDFQRRTDQLNHGYVIAQFSALAGQPSDFVLAADLIRMYAKAMETDYMPQPNELLVMTRPPGLFTASVEPKHMTAVVQKAAKILARGTAGEKLLQAFPV